MESITISFRQLIKETICEAKLTAEQMQEWINRIRNRAGEKEYLGHVMEVLFNECIHFPTEKRQSTKAEDIQNRLMLVAYRLDRNPEVIFKVVYFPVDTIRQKSLESLWSKVIDSEISVFSKQINTDTLKECLIDIIMDCSQRMLTY